MKAVVKAGGLAMLAVVVLVVGTAEAKPAHQANPKPKIHCKTNQRIRRKVIKVRGKRTTKLVCVKKPGAKKSKATPLAPTTVTPEVAPKSSGRIPHSHLDPTFTQDPLNPFSTTWSYSASATEEITDANGVVRTVAAPLPEGTLSFFVNGSLECSVNVGPGNEESDCDVTLTQLGPQKVTTLYSSGSLSSTLTEIDNVGPLPATGGLTYSYEQFAVGVNTIHGLRIGTLHIHDAANPPTAENTNFVNRYPECSVTEEPVCIPILSNEIGIAMSIWDADGNTAAPVYGREGGSGLEIKIDGVTPKGSETETGRWYPVAEIETGGHYLRYDTHLKPGYTGNGTNPILGGGNEADFLSKTTLVFSPQLVSE